MNRRGFLGSILAAAAAPAIARVGSLMAVRPVSIEITGTMLMQEFFSVSIHEQLIAERMRLMREMIAHGILISATEYRPALAMESKNPGDTIVFRRWIPYSAIAVEPREPRP